MSGRLPAPVVTNQPVPKKRDKKGARFLTLFGGDPSPELVQERVGKIKVELNSLAQVAIDVEQGGGDPTEFSTTHARLNDRLTEIDTSTDPRKIKHQQLAVLKETARQSVTDAKLRAPDAIHEGIAATQKTQEAARTLADQVATRRRTVEANLLAIKQALDGAPGPLPDYSDQYDTKMREAEAARTAPDATAAGLWHSLIIGTSGMVTNIPLAGACIEPAKSALFWINKVQSALAALPPETARDAATVTRATALQEAARDLVERKDLADQGRLVNRRGMLLDICDKASTLLEPDRRREVAATLPGTDAMPARNTALDELATSMAGREDLDSQATMRAAITLRFGVEFASSDEFANPLGAGIKKLDALYAVMKLVPPSHLKAKDGTMQLSYKEAQKGEERPNKFARRDDPNNVGKKISTIVMTLPTDGEKIIKKNARGEETELEYFQSTALHEIGHAVDDTENFMGTRGASPRYGQWQPSSRDEVKQKFVTALDRMAAIPAATADLETFVDTCLGGTTPRKPALASDPLGVLLPKWSMLEGAGTAIRGVLEAGALWYKGGATAARSSPDGTRVYFEAYANQWWSFDLGERGASVAEYQWRSPAEWFAEAYSLFYLDKLAADHPVAQWCVTQRAA